MTVKMDLRALGFWLNVAWLALLLLIGVAQGFFGGEAGALMLFAITAAAPLMAGLWLRWGAPPWRAVAVVPNAACAQLLLIGAIGGGMAWPLAVFYLPACANLLVLFLLRERRPGGTASRWPEVAREAALALNGGALAIILYWAATRNLEGVPQGVLVWIVLFLLVCVAGLTARRAPFARARAEMMAFLGLAAVPVLYGLAAGHFEGASGETAVFLALFFATVAANLLAVWRAGPPS